jgi:hypothetical protein
VFWVHASNAARFEQSYRDIANRVKIAGRRDPQANIFELVHNWLCDSRQRWLLVLDNVDDARFLLSGLANGDGDGQTTNAQIIRKPLREYLPHCEHGSILVTTRSKEAALKLVEQRNIISVEPMDKAEGIALFERKLRVQEDSNSVAELVLALEYMPLAIVQAAAYIVQRAPLFSVVKYLEDFRKSESRRLRLLTHDDSQLQRDWEAKSAIVLTWLISFEYIEQTQPGAADLLSLMSLFDRQGISEALLRPCRERAEAQTNQREADNGSNDELEDDKSQSSAGDSESRFRDNVAVLQDFCFISIDTAGTSFGIHALVQLSMRKWLEDNSKLERWKQQFISNLHDAFPTGEYENWAACQALFAHAKAAVGQQPEDESSLAEWATLLYRAAWYAERMGNSTDAATLATKSMTARKKVLGQEHQDTLSSMAMVGSAYRRGGRWDDAEKLEVQVMETCKKKLGADHPSTLTSMANLASTLWNQGRWDAAEELDVQVMETRKKKLGTDHPSTLTSMANLASTYRNQGRWDAAEELEVQVMEIRKKKLGADHPDTLTSMANLASTLWNQGRWDAAEELFVNVMETSKKKLGVDHPDTLNSMNNLAVTLKSLRQDKEALRLLRECVQLCQQRFRADHPNLVSSIATLAQWEAEHAAANLKIV